VTIVQFIVVHFAASGTRHGSCQVVASCFHKGQRLFSHCCSYAFYAVDD